MLRGSFSFLCLLALAVPAGAQTVVQPDAPCEQAGRDAEHEFALPVGLLGAIGKVESGRWDPAVGRVVPSPWAIDAGGQPYNSSNKAAALQVTRALQDSGASNIDVGCFQINLRSHPTAFGDLDQAFDPVANAQYAAKFLTSLRARFGNWQDAVAAYHSATPELGVPYQQAVYAKWSNPEGLQNVLSAAPILTHEAKEPVTVFSVGGGAVVRVWTPGASNAGATIPGLPHVITPGG
jgi:transglycosylase-like protein with SLT domain